MEAGGPVEQSITASKLLEAAHRDLAALDAAVLIATVVDTEPISMVDIKFGRRKKPR
ncbi:hypothetical protein ACFXO7_04860 [Nocardia tengchongensis]|uniref:hypothetical protein n=1 Tax=Nocardia tengchongensis TaxID=2055889 RepID=UPI00368C6F56